MLQEIKTEEENTNRQDPNYEVLAPREAPMQGSVISQIPEYNGAFGSDAESYIKLIDRTKDQYSWSSKATAQMVRSKLTGAARLFVDNQEKALISGIDNWDGLVAGGKNLRQMLLDKFAMPVSAVAATDAIDDLKQEQNETVDSFYERTRFAVDKLLFNVPKGSEDEKRTYRMLFQTQVFIFFKAGLLTSYRAKIFSAAQTQIPITAEALLEAARNAEREMNAGKKILSPKNLCLMEYGNPDQITDKTSISAETPGSGPESNTVSSSSSLEMEGIKSQIAELQRQFRGNRGRGRGGRRGRGGNNRGRGGFQGQRGGFQPQGRGNNWRGNRGRGGFGPKRPDFGCFNCGQMGHWADKCPEPLRQDLQQDKRRNVWAFGEDPNEDQLNEQGNQ